MEKIALITGANRGLGFETARQLVARGCKVMLSNSDTAFIRSIYKGFVIDRVKCPRAINSNAARNSRVSSLHESAPGHADQTI